MAKRKREQAAPATIKGGTGLKMRPGTYTGHEVLQWVIRKVKEEPKRLYMNDWVVLFKGRVSPGFAIPDRDRPSCDTAACMAGWAGIATGNKHVTGSWEGLEALGLQDSKLSVKFKTPDPFDSPLYLARLDMKQLFMMTKASKRAVIAHAEGLAEAHKDVLRAAKVKVKPGWRK